MLVEGILPEMDMTPRFLAKIVILVILPWISSCALYAQSTLFARGVKTGTIESDLLTEISGVTVSRTHPGVLWVHNDSGDKPQLYAIDREGRLLSIYTVTGATARDWEDIAIGPGPTPNQDYLYIGDIGDNNGKYPSITVYRVPEPNVSSESSTPTVKPTAPADSIVLTYPDAPRDAETLFVDPHSKDIYIISKREMACRLYCAPYPQSTEKSTILVFKTLLPLGFIVGGDISTDGQFIIIRSSLGVQLFKRQADKPLWEAFKWTFFSLPIQPEPQGEAVAFDANGQGYYTLSEGRHQPIYYYRKLEKQETEEGN